MSKPSRRPNREASKIEKKIKKSPEEPQAYT